MPCLAPAQSLAAVTVNPSAVVGGKSSSGTVYLTTAAGTGGVSVYFSCPHSFIQLPSSVLIPKGSSSASFGIDTTPVAGATTVSISATASSVVLHASLTVLPPPIQSLTLTPSVVVGGTSTQGKLTLSTAAPTGGLSVGLSSDQSYIHVPSSIQVEGGQTTATFTVHTAVVASSGFGAVTARLGNQSAQASLYVLSPSVRSLTIDPPTVLGSQSAIGTVTLNAVAPSSGIAVQMSSDQGFAQVPTSITVPHGSDHVRFTITTSVVPADNIALIKASTGSLSVSTSLEILAPPVQSLTVTPNPVLGGNAVTGTVTLAVAAPAGGWTITMSSDQSFVTFPYAVSVPAGKKSTSFTIRTFPVGTPGVANLSASAGGIPAGTALTVQPPALSSLVLTPSTVYGGTTAMGKLTVGLPAPAGGEVIELVTNSASIQIPASVTIKAGNHTASFVITTSAVTANGFGDIMATAGSSNATARLNILSRGLATSAWPKYLQGYSNSGLGVASTANGSVAWHINDFGYAPGPAIGLDGTIYVGNRAITSNGITKWKFNANDPDISYSNAAIGSDGTIYLGTNHSKLYALNPDGTQKWIYVAGGALGNPSIAPDGTIYVGSFDHNLYAINPDGSLKWKFLTGNVIWSCPAIGADGTIFFGSTDFNVYALNPDGSQKWAFLTDSYVESSAVLGPDGTIYISSDDHFMYALDAAGHEKWAFHTYGGFGTPSVGPDGTIFVGSSDSFLYAIDPGGTQKWAFRTATQPSTAIAVDAGGTIYFGAGADQFYALNPNGTFKWTGGYGYFTDPAIGADGTIYFVNTDDIGTFFAFGPAH
ncbi:MAG TPA: PQQ-binding-like beta-propeller repeat protein [Fimbriimonas sp.]|nr:PQQ-binding-like beta-propeller repeat protein [Fimbriimonas sp.]